MIPRKERMSSLNRLDRYLHSALPAVINLQKMKSETIEQRIGAAITRINLASQDHYDYISVISIYWATDDTGSKEDSCLFLETISKLQIAQTNMKTHQRVIANDETVFPLLNEVVEQASTMPGKRKLFILHYAGHAIAASKSNSLIITARIGQEESEGPQLDMSLIRDSLQVVVKSSPGLDILLLLDCCCAAVAGRGSDTIGQRMELMAATSSSGLSNSRQDQGKTFTQYWCEAFDQFFEVGLPFDCTDIEKVINANFNLEQFPATFVLREGWGVPIKFIAVPHSTVSTGLSDRTIVMAFHLNEDPGSNSLQHLIEYLEKAPVPITVVASLPISSTLLLVRVPVYLQEFLVLPQVLVLTDA